MYGMCQKTRSETHLNKKQKTKLNCDSSWACASVPNSPPKTKQKAQRKIILYISQEKWKSWKLKNMNKKTQTDKGEKGKDTTTLSRFQLFLAEWMFLLVPAATLWSGTFSSTYKSNISPKKCLTKLGVCTIHNPRVQNLSSPRYTVLQFWDRRTSDGVEAQRVWRQNPDVSIRHRSF